MYKADLSCIPCEEYLNWIFWFLTTTQKKAASHFGLRPETNSKETCLFDPGKNQQMICSQVLELVLCF